MSVRPAAADRLYSSGFELNSLSNNHDCHTVVPTGGSPGLSISTTTVRSGNYALRVNGLSSGAEGSCEFRFIQNPGFGPFYIRAYFRFEAFPGAANRIIDLQACCGTVTTYVTVDNNGILRLYDEDGEITAGIGATLTTGRWYRLELRWDQTGTGATDIVKLYVDGTEVRGATNRNLTFSTQSVIVGGNLNGEANSTGDWFVDDVGINNSAGTNNNGENGLPGEGSIVHLYPNAEGDADAGTLTQTGCVSTSRWDCLEEIPFNDATSFIGLDGNAITNVVDVGVQDFALPFGRQVQFVAVGIRYSADGTGGANHFVRIKSQAGGTFVETNTAFSNAAAHPTFYTHIDDAGLQQYKLTQYMDPQNTTIRWSDSTLDSMQIGAKTTDGSPDTNVSGLWALVEYEVESEANVLTGTYQGDGAASHFINVGFVPDFVMVKGGTDASGAQVAVFRTSTMANDAAKEAFGATAIDTSGTWIKSFDTGGGGGFTVGSNERVNRSGVQYYWTAFKAGPGRMDVGSYTGNGTAGRTITGLGFSPELVFIMSAGAQEAIHRSLANTGAFSFFDSDPDTTSVSSLDANGFTVGSESRVNASATVYHYVAWNEEAGYLDVGTYAGDTQDPRDITGVGFQPEIVIHKRAESGGHTHQRPTSLADITQDQTLEFIAADPLCCRIEQLLSDGFRVNRQWNTNESGGNFFYYAWKRVSHPMLLTGDYTGNAPAAQTIDELGFAPDVVIVKGNTAATAVIKTSTMAGSYAKPMGGATGLAPDLITFAGSGFVVGTDTMSDARVNASGTPYYWIAFKGSASTMKVGTYVGTGVSSPAKTITGLGFSPELVFIMAENGNEAVHRSSASTETHTFDSTTGPANNWITSLDADGFTVATTSSRVNASGVTYHYIAWNEIPGYMDVGSYVGNGADNRSITGVGFEPEYVIVRRYGNNSGGIFGTHHPASLGTTNDEVLWFHGAANTAPGNRIQQLQTDGFEVGNQVVVNEQDDSLGGSLNAEYMYYAWKRPSIAAMTAVRLTAFAATRYDRGVLVQWRTGYEIDNLGFHVYREVNGERVRVTRTVVAGSGLMAGQGTAVNAEQRYAIWDLDATSADRSAVYWLEDLDFNGTSTWHGPVTPVDGGLEAPPDVAPSGSLGDMAKGAKRRGKMFIERGGRLERGGKQGAAPTAQMETQWTLAAQAAVKIGINRPGWYRVTQPELVAAGLDPNVNPRTLQLFVDGLEQPIGVTGAADGRFDSGDAIEFYGAGLDTPYTDMRPYWLVSGAESGRRTKIQGAAARGQATITGGSFPFTVQLKERSIYFAALRNGDEENWFGAFIYEEPTDLPLPVSNVDLTAQAELEVVLQGVTAVVNLDPDHQVAVLVNGAEVGVLRFDGQAKFGETFLVPAGVLREGDNTVTIVARGTEVDYSLVDVVRLRYAHTYRADADLLRFTAEGSGQITVGGFSTSAIRIVDITDPLSPEEIRGAVAAESGLWTVTVRLPARESPTLLAFTEPTVATPAFVRANAASQWQARTNGADYLAVTHAQFAGSVAPLLERRTQQGLSVAHVDIEDVYDEFSFGQKTPQALKDFVRHSHATWQKAPRFLLLVGDATIDPRDYAGFGDADFVPTKQVPMAQISLETPSDDWFADADDDGLPELAVGRFSVRTAEQAEVMVRKTLQYEDGDGIGWSQNVLLVADQNDAGSNFEQTTETLRSLVPSRFSVSRVLSGVSGADIGRSQVIDAVNEGQLIVNYVGHGSVGVWGREANLQTAGDVAERWRNGERLPLVVAMNCLNGRFHGIYDEESLAETLLRTAGGGAVAAWASSGLTASATQARVNEELFRLLFGNPTLTIGEAVAHAKRAVTNLDVRRSWIFFGDPALRLKGIAAQTPATDGDHSSAMTTTVAVAAEEPVMVAPLPSAPPIRLSDWNGDGRDDVFLHSAIGWRAIFSAPKGEHVRGGDWNAAWEVHPGDLNGDGIEDMVLVDRATGTMLHATHDGAGNFAHTEGLLGEQWQLHIADLNGDRMDDLLLTMPGFGFWYTLLNEGGGHFTSRAGSWAAASSITLGDFNGDGRTDAFLYDPDTGAWTTAFSDGTGDFSYASGTTTTGWTVQRANLDGDHRADLLLYNPDTGAWAEWASQDPGRDRRSLGEGGRFIVRDGIWRAGLTVHAVDTTREGRDDVLLYNANSGEWTFVMQEKGDTRYLNGTWQPRLTIATGDLNADGRTDLLLYDPTTGAWQQGLRNRTGSFDFSTGQWAPGWLLASRP